METVQIISRTKSNVKGETLFSYSEIQAPHALDEFDINIIDLSDEYLWRYDGDSKQKTDYSKDYRTLSEMIVNRRNAIVIVQLPQNLKFFYDRGLTSGKYYKNSKLKDMIVGMQIILSELCPCINTEEILYENTKTLIADKLISADFYFLNHENDYLTISNRSKKCTTINVEGLILTTLNLLSEMDKLAFLKELQFYGKEEEAPLWIKDIKILNDDEQLTKIELAKSQIAKLNKEILDANSVLDYNDKLKSILYTTGDELVQVVFMMIEELFDVDLSSFKDEKKEDFLFEKGEKVYIGEIKGVKYNVKNQYISQLELHVQGYLDNHPEKDQKDIVPLLVINHQREIPPKNREAVHEQQVKLAQHYGCLIIESTKLLSLYDSYKKGEISRSEIREKVNHKGLFE